MGKFSGISAIHNTYATDPTLENEGTWMHVSDGDSEVKLRVRSLGSKAAKAQQQQIRDAYFDEYHSKGRKVPQDVIDADNLATVRILVTGWDGFRDAAGAEIPCTPDNVAELMQEYPHLLNDVIQFATRLRNYREQRVRAISGNSAESSPRS